MASERRIVRERYVPLSYARKLVEKRLQEDDVGVVPPLARVRDYLKSFGTRDPELAVKVVEKLVSERGLPEHVAVNIVDICPGSPGEVRSILAMVKELVYDEELVKGILEDISEYCASTYPEE